MSAHRAAGRMRQELLLWPCDWLRLAWLQIAWLLLAGAAAGAQAATSALGPPVVVQAAQRCVMTVEGEASSRAGLKALLALPAPAAGDCWQTVALPDRVPAASWRSDAEPDPLTVVWYRVQVQAPPSWPADEAVMVASARAAGLAWRIRVNGVNAADSLDDWRQGWNVPAAATLPAGTVGAGAPLDVTLALVTRRGSGFALAPLQIGPALALKPQLRWRDTVQLYLPLTFNAAVLVVGLFCFSQWLARRDDRAWLLLALAGLIWGLDYLRAVAGPAQAGSLAPWLHWLVYVLPMPWLTVLVALFTLSLVGVRERVVERALMVYVVLLTLVSAPLWWHSGGPHLLFAGSYTAVGVGTVVYLLWQLRRGRPAQAGALRAVGVALVTCGVAATHDLLLMAHQITPDAVDWVPYAGAVLFASFLYGIHTRNVAAVAAQASHATELARRLAEQEAVLRRQHERLLQMERTHALAGERERLMRDIHDGLGSSLSGLLTVVQQGSVPPTDLEAALQGCMADLRAVVDSLEPLDHDLTTLLATLRWRTQPHLLAAGIEMRWQVDELPPLPWLGPTQALNVIRFMQEALANAMRHARAHTIEVRAEPVHEPAGSAGSAPTHVRVRVCDDGVGFDLQRAHTGRGLRNLPHRAAQLGGRLQIESRPGAGTVLTLWLPIDRPAA